MMYKGKMRLNMKTKQKGITLTMYKDMSKERRSVARKIFLNLTNANFAMIEKQSISVSK